MVNNSGPPAGGGADATAAAVRPKKLQLLKRCSPAGKSTASLMITQAEFTICACDSLLERSAALNGCPGQLWLR